MKYNTNPDDFDRRQLHRMQETLSQETLTRQDLGGLASTLLALRDLFHWDDPDWDYAFTDNVATLDSCSLASPKQIETLGERYNEVIQEAIDSLRKLIREALAR